MVLREIEEECIATIREAAPEDAAELREILERIQRRRKYHFGRGPFLNDKGILTEALITLLIYSGENYEGKLY